jgi:hypothetical protein
VFGFKCSAGLLFDVNRQICDFKLNVDNCDVLAGEFIKKGSSISRDAMGGSLQIIFVMVQADTKYR